VETTEHLAELRRHGELLGAAAERSDLDTPIPTCPDWTMRDLLRHMGDVHRWAAAHVEQGRMQPIRVVEEVAGPVPGDADLLAWFREGHDRLVRTLSEADPDMACWTFLPAPSPLAFWTRRQSHETSIHRADAESPGGVLTAFDPRFAADGIDYFVLYGPEFDHVIHEYRTLTGHAPMLPRLLARAVQLLGQRAIQNVVHQRRFPRPRHARHHRHHAQREVRSQLAQVMRPHGDQPLLLRAADQAGVERGEHLGEKRDYMEFHLARL